jgi:opacity protein-like surface antigen
MKKTIQFVAATAFLMTSAVFAGEVTYTDTSTPPNPAIYGTGFYMGIQAGVNAYQDFGGSRRYSLGATEIELDPQEKVGFVGGIKAGYVFGTGTVRPAIEADLYYNGVEGDIDARFNGNDTEFNGEAKLHSGAFMGNFILRFAFDRFQPYIGAGAGVWIAEADDIEVTVAGRTRTLGNASSNGFAWQLIGGADYYFTEKFSLFAEYKYLNYEDAGIQEDTIDQHLVVLGLRWHF